mgnify:CR=1 FL=1
MNPPELSVVVPVFNEEGNVGPLLDEIVAALRGLMPFEVVMVDDRSRDGTLRHDRPGLAGRARGLENMMHGDPGDEAIDGGKGMGLFGRVHVNRHAGHLVMTADRGGMGAVLAIDDGPEPASNRRDQ